MDETDLERALEALARTWLDAMPRRSLGAILSPPPAPAGLADTVTAHAPQRAEVLRDAAAWLSRGRPFGLGLTVRWVGGRPRPGPGGEPGFEGARFELSWADRMDTDGQQVEREPLVFAALWREAGGWRVGRLFDAVTREALERERALLRQHFERGG